MCPCPKGFSLNLQTCHDPNYEWQKHVLKKHHQNFSRKGHILAILIIPSGKQLKNKLVANWKAPFYLPNLTQSNWAMYLIQLSATDAPLPVWKEKWWTVQEHR